jgi:hypothetical protein
LINLLGVYYHDAHGATAEREDLFGSAICRRGKRPAIGAKDEMP